MFSLRLTLLNNWGRDTQCAQKYTKVSLNMNSLKNELQYSGVVYPNASLTFLSQIWSERRDSRVSKTSPDCSLQKDFSSSTHTFAFITEKSYFSLSFIRFLARDQRACTPFPFTETSLWRPSASAGQLLSPTIMVHL